MDITPTVAELLATLSSFSLTMGASVDFGVEVKEEYSNLETAMPTLDY